jgi:HKD family nuclease
MAEIKVLLQGLVQGDDHLGALKSLLLQPDVERVLCSVAYLRESGVNMLGQELAFLANKIEIYVGIRNGVTSVQGVLALLKLGIKPYAVDTASARKIFHPKMYMGYNKHQATIIMGSANLTANGLSQNIESSLHASLSRSCVSDETAITKLIDTFTDLPNQHPQNVFRIDNVRAAVRLMSQRRLMDERLMAVTPGAQIANSASRDGVPGMRTVRAPRVNVPRRASPARRRSSGGLNVLVWESKPLSRRHLNIPTGQKTNITGDFNLTSWQRNPHLDFKHYFRDQVFDQVVWRTDSSSQSPALERAKVDVEIIVKGVNCGLYNLEITHDPRTNTASYAQNNAMTKIKWGAARSLVASDDLLDRTLLLYKRRKTDFVIEIS